MEETQVKPAAGKESCCQWFTQEDAIHIKDYCSKIPGLREQISQILSDIQLQITQNKHDKDSLDRDVNSLILDLERVRQTEKSHDKDCKSAHTAFNLLVARVYALSDRYDTWEAKMKEVVEKLEPKIDRLCEEQVKFRTLGYVAVGLYTAVLSGLIAFLFRHMP